MSLPNNSLPDDLTNSTNLFKKAFDAAVSGIIIIDHQQPDDPIVYCNEAFEKLTGYCKADILGENCRFLQGDDRGQDARYTLKDALIKEEPCAVELINYRKDGTPFWNEIHISPIKNDKGEATHFIGVQNNVSDRKLRELALENELKQSRKLQQQKDEFISVASHELKTPMTSLKGALQLLERLMGVEVQSSKMLILLGKANVSLKRLSALIEDLLNVSRLEVGKMLNKSTDFLLADLIEELLEQYNIESKFKITFSGNRFLEVTADKLRIEQVLTNLIDNAIKFSPTSRNIHVYVEEEGNVAKVMVRDFGIGIAPDKIPHLFDRYYKVDNSGLQVSGLGLGLYLSNEIVTSHGGEIGVDSEQGKGSTFWFTLPLRSDLQ